MQAEGVIAALIGALSGGGGTHLFRRLFGTEREAFLEKAYRSMIKTQREDNDRLRERCGELEKRIVSLEKTVEKITFGELPPEYS
jgi:hypothetical protein